MTAADKNTDNNLIGLQEEGVWNVWNVLKGTVTQKVVFSSMIKKIAFIMLKT